jgi:hypothetical protein
MLYPDRTNIDVSGQYMGGISKKLEDLTDP